MNIAEAFPETSMTASTWDYPNINCTRNGSMFANLDDAYEQLMQSRVTDITGQSTLEASSLDSVKLVNSFKEHKEELTSLCKKIEDMEKRLKDINVDYTSMNDAMLRITVSWGHSGLSVDDTKPVTDSWDAFSKLFKSKIDDAVNYIQKELKDLHTKKDKVEENMAAMRQCVLLGVQMMVPEEKAQKHLCPVCFDQEVNMVLIPCGHTACSSCTKQIGDTCMSCRRRVNSKHTLFFSA